MVTIESKIGDNGLSEVYFLINSCHSIEDINNKAIVFADRTMNFNVPNMSYDWPVYIKNKIRDTPMLIGFIRITTEKHGYIIDHLTVDKKIINSDWDVEKFYGGHYGLQSE